MANILYSSGFKTSGPKMFRNVIRAIHVGSVHGIHCETAAIECKVFEALRLTDFSKRVVALSNGFLKVEVKQMNTVLNSILKRSYVAE